MPYTLQRFGSVFLPTGMPITPIGTGETLSASVQLVDGAVYDGHGEDRDPLRLPYDLIYRAMLWESTTALLQTSLDALKGLRGVRDVLYRQMPNGDNHWCTARLVGVRGEREVVNVRHQTVELVFKIFSPWYGDHHGAPWCFGDGPEFGDGHVFGESDQYYLDQYALNLTGITGTFAAGDTITGETSGATGTAVYAGTTFVVMSGVAGTFQNGEVVNNGGTASATTASVAYPATYVLLSNGGDATVDNAVITVDVPVGSPDVTALTIISPALSTVTYSGTVLAGTSLVIDVGAWSVLNDGADDYDGLERNSGHAVFPWLEIAAPSAWVGVARTGGDDLCTITFDYSDRWE